MAGLAERVDDLRRRVSPDPAPRVRRRAQRSVWSRQLRELPSSARTHV
jgi:hypothetical protein